jgi:hypothetical protein
MHKTYANQKQATSDPDIAAYNFRFPLKQNVIDALTLSNKLQRRAGGFGTGSQPFVGLNPLLMATADATYGRMQST